MGLGSSCTSVKLALRSAGSAGTTSAGSAGTTSAGSAGTTISNASGMVLYFYNSSTIFCNIDITVLRKRYHDL